MSLHRDRQSPARKLKGAPRAKRAKLCKRFQAQENEMRQKMGVIHILF